MQSINELKLYNVKITDIYEFDQLLQTITDEFNNVISQETGFSPRFMIAKEKEHMLPLQSDNIRSKYGTIILVRG